MNAKLSWAADGSVLVNSVPELDKVLDTLEEEARSGEPFIVQLILPNGDMGMGLGENETVLDFISGSEKPPYYSSTGGRGNSNLVFYYYGSWSEFTPDQAVPLALGREAMRYFLVNGTLAPFVAWVEV